MLGRRIQAIRHSNGHSEPAEESTRYVYAGENAIIETSTDLQTSAVKATNRIYGNGTDDLLAYETDDSTLPDTDSGEHSFCSSKVLPYGSDFTKYGYTDIMTRCNTLETAYNATERKLFYVHKDTLGSTIALTDASGSLVQSYAYDVYGTPYVRNATSTGAYVAVKDFIGNLHGNDRLFTGREYESELGLYYYRARFYDPSNGRFLSRDPIGMADQVNLYIYVADNPLKFTDPSGKEKKSILQIFENARKDFSKARKMDVPFVKNDFEPDLNISYFLLEFSARGRNSPDSVFGKYDLVMGGKGGLERNLNVNSAGNVMMGGSEIPVGEISNILAGMNAHRMGFTQEHLENAGMGTVKLGLGNGEIGEYGDRILYGAGYQLGYLEEQGKLTEDNLVSTIKTASKMRAEFISIYQP